MHGMNNIRFANAKQAETLYNYKNRKEKLCKTKAGMWFNKICKIERLTPKYIHTSEDQWK
jgi:hypothetical protein